MNDHKYKGHIIRECPFAGDPHGGRWFIVAYHPRTGLPYQCNDTEHFNSLREAREHIAFMEEVAS